MSIDPQDRLEFLQAAGDPFEVGATLGRFGADAVHGHLARTEAWASVTAPAHRERLAEMERLVRERFPRIMAELEGLAAGLALPFGDVFAWNCRGDLWAMAPDGCTTVQVPGNRRVIAHNEDGDPGLRGRCALFRSQARGGAGFTAFVYPGSLPGHTFAATDHGLVQTVNNIRALDVGDGVPRMVLARAMLDCASIDEAVRLVQGARRAGSFHVTLAQTGDPRLLSLEFTRTACSTREITGPDVHANHLVHASLAAVPQVVTASSASRQKRGALLAAAGEAERDPMSILLDADDPRFPIRRDDPRDPDHENTLASAVFVIEEDRLNWYVYVKAGELARIHIDETSTADV